MRILLTEVPLLRPGKVCRLRWPTTRSIHLDPLRANTDVLAEQITRLASQPLHVLKLSDLVRWVFASSVSHSPVLNLFLSHGHPPLSAEALLSSANFTLSLLPIRLAHRIQALRSLPYIVVSNPNVSRIYDNYIHSLSTLMPYHEKQISTIEEEIQFAEVMADLVETHANTIPTLARGFLESRKYISPDLVTKFLDEHLRTRIGTRLIAEQHLALHASSLPHTERTKDQPLELPKSYNGVIDTKLSPVEIIRTCEMFVAEICEMKHGIRPTVVVNGHIDALLTHVPTHLEYIITELLKNSFRATVEKGVESQPVEVTIAASYDELPACGAQAITTESTGGRKADLAKGITVRIRDRGGGIDPRILSKIWGYSFTTFGDEDTLNLGSGEIDALNTISGAGGMSSSLAGLGYGLPLGRAYAEHFGGSIQLQSLWGWGTDVYLTLRGLSGIS